MSRKRIPIDVLVDRRVSKTDTCWLWTGEKNRWGYGRISIERPDRQRFLVHRLMYERFVGPIPEGKILMHTCDVRNCCNPEHLIPGTQAENLADARAKGRFPGRKRKQ